MKTLITSLFLITVYSSISQKDDKRFCFEPLVGTFIPKINYFNTNNINLTNKEHYGYKFGVLKNIGIGQIFVVRPTIAFTAFKRESYFSSLNNNSTPVLFNNLNSILK